jgi:hypothetical protein
MAMAHHARFKRAAIWPLWIKLENVRGAEMPPRLRRRGAGQLVALRQSAYKEAVLFRGMLRRVGIRGKAIHEHLHLQVGS